MNNYDAVYKEELYSALVNLYHMPESDGTNLTAKIRRDVKHTAKRLIDLVTGAPTTEDKP